MYKDEEWLKKIYIDDRKPIYHIATICNCTELTIKKWLDKFNINIRSFSEQNSGKYNGSWIESPIKELNLLYKEYITNQKSIRKIAEEYEVSPSLVSRLLRKYNIPKFTTQDYVNRKKITLTCKCGKEQKFLLKSKKLYQCNECIKKEKKLLRKQKSIENKSKYPRSFTMLLYDYVFENWRLKVFERDNFTCRICNDSRGGNLQAHHIIPFAFIRDRLVMENAHVFDLSIESGIKKLYEKSIKDERLNDIDNGITLCKKCHENVHKQIHRLKDFELYRYNVEILQVYDGDSFLGKVDLGFKLSIEENFRLYGVDASELKSKDINKKGLAFKAKAALEEILQIGRIVQIRTFKPGKFGRWLAILDLNEMDYNQYMVYTGLFRECYY